MSAHERLTQLLDPVVSGLGYELVGVEFEGRTRALRVYIDRDGGVSLEDCSRVSYHVSGILDVEDPISGRYHLEVSSPGLDRPLFSIEHYQRFEGQIARIHLARLVDGRRKFKGRLAGVQDHAVLIEEGETLYRVPYDAIENGRLEPELFAKKSQGSRYGK